MTETFRIQVKAPKVTVPIEASAFPLDMIPTLGTPGLKKTWFTYELEHEGAILSASIRVPSLQRLAAAVAAAPQGGFVIVQGRLGPTNTLIEAGVIFQPHATAGVPEEGHSGDDLN